MDDSFVAKGVFVRLSSRRMAVSTRNLHRNRSSQGTTAEQRQPNGQNYCYKFCNGTQHKHSMAKFDPAVKRGGALPRFSRANAAVKKRVLRRSIELTDNATHWG